MERLPNAEQQKVIENLDENLILFASAGTGKTFTVAKRVSQIIQTERALPEEILCLTFTTKACDEMRSDVLRYVGERGNNVEIRTIHGFCYQLMREENRRGNDKYSEAVICDEVDGEELIKSILSSQLALWESGKTSLSQEEMEELEDRQFDIFSKKGAVRNFVSALKHVREEQGFYKENEESDYQRSFDFIRQNRVEMYGNILSYSSKGGGQVCDEAFERAMTRFAGRLIFAYDDHLRQSNHVDYDDLIIFASRYLEKEEVLARWATRYKYIIVDEMQDTSLLEYSVLKRIFAKNNVMMCGDFFQSIYEWRGSKPEYVLDDFIRHFSAKVQMFSRNYRSTKTLTQATFGYLKETYPRLVGKYCPENIFIHSEQDGEKILCMGFDNRREEGYQIYRYIRKHLPTHPFGLCVMARSNFYITQLARTFEECNAEFPENERLHFFTAEEQLQFYRKPVIKDVLAVVKLLLNKTDRVSMERIAEKYVRQIGVKSIEQLRLQNRVGASIVSFLDWQTYQHKDPYHVLIEAFHKGEIVIYDTETTGLDLSKDQMVQLSAIRLDRDGNITATFDQMIIPDVPIGKGAYETHGFDMEYIRTHGGVTAKEALTAFSAFVEGAALVGHNSFRFDAPLIRRQLKENGLPPLKIAAEYDTLVIAKQFHAALPDFRLSTLCFKYGIVNEAAHNAYGDIVATGKVLCRMIAEDVIPSAMERRNVCEKYQEKFEKFYQFISSLSARLETDNAHVLAMEIVEKMHIEKYYPTDSDRRAIAELLRKFQAKESENAATSFREFVLYADLSGGRADLLMEKQNSIPMLTVHQAKGCEFDVVILAGVDDRNFPNFYAKNERTEEEEKKVFYVAISRAKERLIMTRAAYNGRERVYPSPYAEKIPREYVWMNERWLPINE